MIKPVSTLSIIVAGVMCIVPTFGAQMTPQIQRLLDQKQENKEIRRMRGQETGLDDSGYIDDRCDGGWRWPEHSAGK